MKILQTTLVTNIKQSYKNGITGSTLKIIAIISMFIDHIGSIILERAIVQREMSVVAGAQMSSAFFEANAELYYAFFTCKMIGRMAFPIFCFLLVEGFMHTHNLKKYLGRMVLFAIISEIPFDLAFFGVPFYWGYQNVYFTLFFGILAISGIQLVEQKKEWNILWRILFCILTVGLCLGLAKVLCTDYDILGILTITIIYLFRKRKTLSVGLGCIPLQVITAFVSLIPIHLYNGKRGRSIKWIFYLFYPVHIFLLYLIAFALGLGQITLL